VRYLITVAGEFTLLVKTNGDEANVKSSIITVVPDTASPADSTLNFNSVVQVAKQETVLVSVYDKF